MATGALWYFSFKNVQPIYSFFLYVMVFLSFVQVAKECAEARPQVLRELLSLDLDTISNRDIMAIMLKLNISAHDCLEREVCWSTILEEYMYIIYVSGHNERNRDLSYIPILFSNQACTSLIRKLSVYPRVSHCIFSLHKIATGFEEKADRQCARTEDEA